MCWGQGPPDGLEPRVIGNGTVISAQGGMTRRKTTMNTGGVRGIDDSPTTMHHLPKRTLFRVGFKDSRRLLTFGRCTP